MAPARTSDLDGMVMLVIDDNLSMYKPRFHSHTGALEVSAINLGPVQKNFMVDASHHWRSRHVPH